MTVTTTKTIVNGCARGALVDIKMIDCAANTTKYFRRQLARVGRSRLTANQYKFAKESWDNRSRVAVSISRDAGVCHRLESKSVRCTIFPKTRVFGISSAVPGLSPVELTGYVVSLWSLPGLGWHIKERANKRRGWVG